METLWTIFGFDAVAVWQCTVSWSAIETQAARSYIVLVKHLIAVTVLLICGSPAVAQQPRTLVDVLRSNSILPGSATIPHLHSRISSYAVLNDSREFLLAYYLETTNNELRFPLYVSKLDKHFGKWRHAELSNLTVMFSTPQSRGTDFNTRCIGSVVDARRYDDRYYLDLHLSPSAGCVLILKPDLSVDQTLPGWRVAFLKGALLWEKNMIHFAPTSPGELWISHLGTRQSNRLYPQPNDPVRRAYKKRLTSIVDNHKCKENNWTCDPQQFTSEIGDVKVSDDGGAFAVLVTFTPQGFIAPTDNSFKELTQPYVYIYRLHPSDWRVFPSAGLKARFGTDSIEDMLSPAKLGTLFRTSR